MRSILPEVRQPAPSYEEDPVLRKHFTSCAAFNTSSTAPLRVVLRPPKNGPPISWLKPPLKIVLCCKEGPRKIKSCQLPSSVFDNCGLGDPTGWEELDDKLESYCVQEFQRRNSYVQMYATWRADQRGPDFNPPSHKRALQRLRTLCQRARHTLLLNKTATIKSKSLFQGASFACGLERVKAEVLKNRSSGGKCIVETLEASHGQGKPVDEIILVGF